MTLAVTDLYEEELSRASAACRTILDAVHGTRATTHRGRLARERLAASALHVVLAGAGCPLPDRLRGPAARALISAADEERATVAWIVVRAAQHLTQTTQTQAPEGVVRLDAVRSQRRARRLPAGRVAAIAASVTRTLVLVLGLEGLAVDDASALLTLLRAASAANACDDTEIEALDE